jgi:hypothetical protein
LQFVGNGGSQFGWFGEIRIGRDCVPDSGSQEFRGDVGKGFDVDLHGTGPVVWLAMQVNEWF